MHFARTRCVKQIWDQGSLLGIPSTKSAWCIQLATAHNARLSNINKCCNDKPTPLGNSVLILTIDNMKKKS